MTDIEYDEYEVMMHKEYPKIFANPYGGFAVGQGWHRIIKSLCGQIQHHIDWKNEQFEKYKRGEPVAQVTVAQIKEKFGGLRFYYDGGDSTIDGMVRMAESWAANTCEECGVPSTKHTSGWIKNVCDKHYDEIEQRKKERFGVEE